MAIMTDVVGFALIGLIPIDIIREMALNATLGMAAIIITNKVMMPIMLTWVDIGDPVAFQEKQDKRDSVFDPVWRLVSNMVRPRSVEHTSELQSLMRTSYAVFCLKKTKNLK